MIYRQLFAVYRQHEDSEERSMSVLRETNGQDQKLRGEWSSCLCSFRQVTEVKLSRVRSNSGRVTSDA